MSLAAARIAGQVVPGVEVTRAWSAAFAWNVGRRAPTRLPGTGGERELSKRPNRKELSTVAGPAGGPVRSSAEAPVMGVERRGRIARSLFV